MNQHHPNIRRIIEEGYFVRSLDYLKEAYSLIRNHILILAIYTAVFFAISYVLFLKGGYVGNILQSLLNGPFIAGYFYGFQQIYSTKTLQKESLFLGFQNFLPIVMVTVVSNLIVTIGLYLYILPGIFFYVSYLFALPIVIFSRMDFWAAMESSRMIVWKQFLQMFYFALMIIIVNFAGIILLGVGVLFTFPLSQAALFLAYKSIFSTIDRGEEREEEKPEDSDDNQIKLEHFR